MKKNTWLSLIVVTLFLGLYIVFAAVASAAPLAGFPLLTNDGVLVADEHTKYITLFKQDAATKLITATVQVSNGGPQEIEIRGIGIEISFGANVAPYSYNAAAPAFFAPGKSYTGDGVFQDADFAKYCSPLLREFRQLGSQYIQRSAGKNVIGAKYSCTSPVDALKLAPGQAADLISFYFMPLNRADALDLNTFSYEYVDDANVSMIRLTTAIMNGSSYLLPEEAYLSGIFSAVFVKNQNAFKIHVQHPRPNVSANNSNRTVNGYNSATMEWSYNETGPYTGGAPVVKDEAHTIYIRVKGDSGYSGNDALYGNYKQYLTSDAVAVSFTVKTGGGIVEDDVGGGVVGGGGVVINGLIVTFNGNGGTPNRTNKETPPNTSLGSNMPAAPTRAGFTFTGWNTKEDGSGSDFIATTRVTADISVYAQWINNADAVAGGIASALGDVMTIGLDAPPLAGFLAEHIPFISGYPDNTMRPNNAITRAEVAMIFFRLLSSPDKNTTRASIFSDIADGIWYAQAVNYLASIEIITGYPGGIFSPNQPITRAEFAAVASRFDNLATTSGNAFPDVEGHWAIDYINSAYAKGWVGGYPEGTFKPQQNITRAEVVKVVNTMLNRKIHLEDIPAGIKQFTDIEGHWAYTDIVEACNDHDFTRKNDGYELWVLK